MNVSLRQLPGDGMGREWGSLAWCGGTGGMGRGKEGKWGGVRGDEEGCVALSQKD